MRVTSSMYYKSLYSQNNSQLNSKLFDVNKQIASGLKIQYAKDDVRTFTETMRLDNEITTLEQIKKSTESGYKVSNQTDVALNEFETNMNRMRTLLLNAANGTNDATSLDAIASELRGIEDGFRNLANTSINGQYLFSGSAVDVKPISDDGTYNGNDVSMKAFLGSRSQQEYNITGAELFLGEEVLVRREVTTNVLQGLNAPTSTSQISGSSTISEFMGDIGAPNNHYFYIRGTQSDGTAIKTKITMTDAQTVDELLTGIGTSFGNTANLDVVNVSMNSSGQIVIQDKLKGSSKLDFHLVGATDFSGGGAANVNDIDSLDTGSTDYSVVTATPGLYIKEFVKSPFASAVTGGTTNDAILYDRTEFTKSGPKLSSNVPQVLKDGNAFATDSTKLHEVFSGVTYNSDGTYASGLDTKVLKLEGTTTSGVAYDVSINLLDAGSTFTVTTPLASAGTYDIFNVENTRVASPASEVTYKQLMDVINMTVTGNLPAANTSAAYDSAISSSNNSGGTFLTHDGKINFQDTLSVSTNATMSLYDSNSDNFTLASSVSTFNTNNALTIRDPKTDFFKTINEIITAVENHKLYPNSSSGDMRNAGIENAIAMMDDIQDHVFRSHSVVGAQSNTLTTAIERTSILEIGTKTLRSSVIDTDLAEASLKLTQLTLNYEAMLSTVGRVSKLSLVNYL